MTSTQPLHEEQQPGTMAASAGLPATDHIMGFDLERDAGRADASRRALDVALSSILMVATSPIVAIAALAIRLDSDGPIFYRQVRVGRHGRAFSIIKFRTMVTDAEAEHGARLASHQDRRVTRVGRVLRASRLDELPQLLNIVRGEMSLVGPRPERPEFVSEFVRTVPGYRLRHLVRPGLTGPAQIKLGYDATPHDKLVLDLGFVRDPSLPRYLLTAASTPLAVLAWMRCAGSSCAAPLDGSVDDGSMVRTAEKLS